jgi:hypothetical protein
MTDPLTGRELWKYELTQCEDQSNRLSEWELGFIESIHDILEQGWVLSSRQAEKLEQIYGRLP